MRKLIAFLGVSLDGFHADAAGGLEWQTFGPEFTDFSLAQLDEVDALLFGRTTYDGMIQYWPQQAGTEFDDRIAQRMNSIRKYVVSRTLPAADWNNTTLLRDPDEVAAVDADTVAIFGSSSLVAGLIQRGLLSELRLMVNPIVLGSGARMLDGIDLTHFALLGTRPFEAGNVLLTYRPAAA
ncbi:dihydrofolate reductase [Kribbella amoyensis]|uniref:Dihydrofolate reductase n=2 Tax=Kribbella amoyensis TaxID=996641 RepID=A0A561BKQ7_9ACTN|nr:dihydrofolate reductase family protein [Kribbella amoyensis]TWD79466.1 dihydrofolate reductase [Kribbella amoyensis]